MRRLELQEIHDHPKFPNFLRDLVTDALQSLWNFGNSYEPILARLLQSMKYAGTREVLDLCSGGGGPWPRLARELDLQQQDSQILVRLTDKYPNQGAFEQARATTQMLQYEPTPIDATRIPADLRGFRTIFSSFHHFGPDRAREVLEDAVRCRRGFGTFEVARRSPKTMLTICLLPAISWLLAPSIRPFRWSRLFWTYVIPVVPFVLFYDGMVSCLRAYSRQELEELVEPLAKVYEWHMGEERRGFLPVTYLLGYPVREKPDFAD
ncbi:hypothetical protein ACPOL_1553 [Acidisarcina polymorpha]|uniref:Methyltransferase domain-containing protein n=1 Tax=Acidisarcina polymorpha TaxID=2211140 RepID=A0A2Z5FVH8_9BACT|nr:class I SAM-dependent methyltransferase [Acidisarcina polymorpha]AXC10899.1 hypothetical protein ACPOL_1553 [Acidisarcina polymorpha]